jgi:hypothetical protein
MIEWPRSRHWITRAIVIKLPGSNTKKSCEFIDILSCTLADQTAYFQGVIARKVPHPIHPWHRVK